MTIPKVQLEKSEVQGRTNLMPSARRKAEKKTACVRKQAGTRTQVLTRIGTKLRQAWWFMPVVPGLGRLRQRTVMSSRSAWDTATNKQTTI